MKKKHDDDKKKESCCERAWLFALAKQHTNAYSTDENVNFWRD